MRKLSVMLLAATMLLGAVTLGAQDRRDEEATEMIREYTTEERFLTPLVDYLPASDTVPSQLEVLGYISGTPGKMTYYDDIVRYFRTLDDASERVKVFDIGRSHQGNMMIMVAVADADVIANLDRYRGFTAELADPRGCDEARMKEIVGEAKPIYMLTGGLHSPETGSPEMLMEMAYRLVVSDTEMIKRIRSKVITLIIPVLETDGWNRQVDWYYRHTIDYDDWENKPPSSPPYWGDYTRHDNNRDGIMVSQALTRNFFNAFFDFHPQVAHDLHESVPLLYISTGTGPYYTAQDPVTIFEWQWFAFNEVTQMTSYGVPGVWTHGFYTGWYPGYLLWLPNNHNAIGRFYETFGNAGANTYERKISRGSRFGAARREWYRPEPAPEKVMWSYRNNTNLMQSACLIALDFTARHADTVLENFWIKSNNAVEAGRSEAPYAWIVPTDQKDPLAANRLIDVFRRQRIEMHRLTEELTIGEEKKAKTWPAGSIVVRLDQPYRTIAKTLLEIQKWPEGNTTNPYDATGWTLSLMLDVQTDRVDDAAVLEAAMEPLGDHTVFGGERGGMRQSDYLLAKPQGTATINTVIALLDADVEVKVADNELAVGEEIFPAGTIVLPGYAPGDELGTKIGEICDKYKLNVFLPEGGFEVPELRTIQMPRVAMYHTWFNTQESGWTRFALEQDNVPYELIDKDDVRAGNLNDSLDVIILPHQGGWGTGARILRGVDDRFGPIAYTKTEKFKYHGYPDTTENGTGGLGLEGALELEKFIKNGGTLITLGSGTSLVTDLGFLRGVYAQSQPRTITCPGTILTATVRQPGNPIAYGYGEHPALYRSRLPLLNVSDHMRKYVVLQFGTKDPDGEGGRGPGRYGMAGDEGKAGPPAKKTPLLKSGLLRNGSAIDGAAAIIDAPLGEGRVVLFGFNPMYRWMNHANFSYVYNAMLHWQAPAELREAPEKEEEEKAEND